MNEGLYPIGRQPAALAMRLRAFNKLLSGTGTYTPRPGTKLLRVRKWGGGGGSGGAGSSSSVYGISSAGADGQYTDEWISHSPGATYAWAIGAGGTAGPNTPGNGGNGGSTTFDGTMSASGGIGGQQSLGVSSFSFPLPAASTGPGAGGQAVRSYGGSNQTGNAGQAGLILVEEY